jgi:hypothetical protein
MKFLDRVISKLFYNFFFSRSVFSKAFLNFLAILLGFFSSSTLATILGQTGDWGILSSGILVAIIESTNKLFYIRKKKEPQTLLLIKHYYKF